jgi:hypothetical protein
MRVIEGRRLILIAQWLLWLVALVPGMVGAAALVEGPTVELPSGSNAVVRWVTDVATGGRVHYGSDLSRLTLVIEDGVRNQHSVLLTGLHSGSKYFYIVGTARVSLATNSFVTPGRIENTTPSREVKASQRDQAMPSEAPRAPPTRETWGNLDSLRDHFERHGADFKAKDPDDYAWQAWEFRQRARAEGLPAKVDEDGVVRMFDPKTGAFGAYSRDGKTKTYFKPGSRDYFQRQPGQSVNAKSLKF